MIVTPAEGVGGYKVLFMQDYKAWAAVHSLPISNWSYFACDFHFWKQGAPDQAVRAEFENDTGEMGLYVESNAGKPAWFGYQQGATHLWSHGYDPSDANTWKLSQGFGIPSGANANLNVRADNGDVYPQQGNGTSNGGALALYRDNACTARFSSPGVGNVDLVTNGAAGLTRAVRWTSSGTRNMLVGPTASANGMTGGVALGGGTAPTGPVPGVVQLWVEGGALKAMGGNGTITVLAPA